jgi:hypothetical protein
MFRWLEVTNRTGGLVTLAFGGGRCPLAVPPGRWRYEWDRPDARAEPMIEPTDR